jgi:hypothetical protein
LGMTAYRPTTKIWRYFSLSASHLTKATSGQTLWTTSSFSTSIPSRLGDRPRAQFRSVSTIAVRNAEEDLSPQPTKSRIVKMYPRM